MNNRLKIIDPLNGQTSFSYGQNRNLLTVQDARTNTTTYTPDSMDRLGPCMAVLERNDSLVDVQLG